MTGLAFFVVTHRTREYGDRYVVRRMTIGPFRVRGTKQYDISEGVEPWAIAETLEEARARIPVEYDRLESVPKDDPVVVEAWFR